MKSSLPAQVTIAISALIRIEIGHFDAFHQLHDYTHTKEHKAELKAELKKLEEEAEDQKDIIHKGLQSIIGTGGFAE